MRLTLSGVGLTFLNSGNVVYTLHTSCARCNYHKISKVVPDYHGKYVIHCSLSGVNEIMRVRVRRVLAV